MDAVARRLTQCTVVPHRSASQKCLTLACIRDRASRWGLGAEFIGKLKWMDKFVKEEVEPLDTFGFSPYDTTHPARVSLSSPIPLTS